MVTERWSLLSTTSENVGDADERWRERVSVLMTLNMAIT